MVDFALKLAVGAIQFLIVVGIFAVLLYVSKFILNKFKGDPHFEYSRFFNPQEYLPEEELSSIRQVGYLIMILILVMLLFIDMHQILRLQ